MPENQSQEELPGAKKYEDEAGYQRHPANQGAVQNFTSSEPDSGPGEAELAASEAAGRIDEAEKAG